MKRKVGKALGEAIILLVVSVFGIVMSILSHNSFNVEHNKCKSYTQKLA